MIPLPPLTSSLFFFNDTATTEIYTLSLHDALPISSASHSGEMSSAPGVRESLGETKTSLKRSTIHFENSTNSSAFWNGLSFPPPPDCLAARLTGRWPWKRNHIRLGLRSTT